MSPREEILEKENRILKREYKRLEQDLQMLSNLNDYASRLRNFNEERVVAANRAKSNFLANMSHEIRTPMNAIIGMDEMIIRETQDPKISKYALDIKSASKTLLSIINDILDLSRIESGRMEIIPVEYDSASVFNDIANMTRKKAIDKGLDYYLDVAKDIPARLYGDEIRIRQIMLNIINNAVKYTEEGGIRISVTYDPRASGFGPPGQSRGSIFKNALTTVPAFVNIIRRVAKGAMRKCRNWQTSKTKDLVGAISCEFKSHLPHLEKKESHAGHGSLSFHAPKEP